MKKIFCITFIMLFVKFNVIGQASNITKQDALDFLQKAYTDYACGNTSNNCWCSHPEGISNIKVYLDSSNLIIESDQLGDNNESETGGLYNIIYRITIPLNESYLKDGTLNCPSNNIFTDVKFNRRLGAKFKNGTSFYRQQHNIFMGIGTKLIAGVISKEFSDSFIENNMEQRMIKAFQFLIDECGGGEKIKEQKTQGKF